MTNKKTSSLEIISFACDARTYAFNALTEAKNGNIKEAEILLEKANTCINSAHEIQNNLLFDEFHGKQTEIDLLMLHAQDHLMTCILAIELLKEIIVLYKKI